MRKVVEIWADVHSVETLSDVISVNLEDGFIVIQQEDDITYLPAANIYKFVVKF